VKTRQLIQGQRNFRGRLLGLDGECVLFEDRTNGRVQIPLESIAKANLELDIDEELRKTKGR
jgi:ribosome maturation factor RimP